MIIHAPAKSKNLCLLFDSPTQRFEGAQPEFVYLNQIHAERALMPSSSTAC